MTQEDLICSQPRCTKNAQEYTYPIIEDDQDPETVTLCDDHASKAGFCIGCGYFCAGIESYDFPESPFLRGLCEVCAEASKWDCPSFWGLEDDEEYEADYYY